MSDIHLTSDLNQQHGQRGLDSHADYSALTIALTTCMSDRLRNKELFRKTL
jgi:hypothetical protein